MSIPPINYISTCKTEINKDKKKEIEAAQNIIKEKAVGVDFKKVQLTVQDSKTSSKVDDLKNEILLKNLKLNLYSYNILINEYLKEENFEAAVSLFNEMQAEKINPAIETFNVFFRFFIQKVINRDNLKPYFQHMVKEQPVYRYTNKFLNIFKDFAEKLRTKKIVKFIKTIEKEGLRPSHETYNHLLNLFVKRKCFWAAKQLKGSMDGTKISPDQTTYNLFMELLLKKERVGEALIEIQKMSRVRISPNLHHCQTLLNLLIKKSRVDDAITLFDEMKKHHLQCDTETLNNLHAFLQKHEENPIYLRAFNKSEE